MTKEDWEELIKAFDLLKSSTTLKRLDGRIWSVYRVGLTYRIDIQGLMSDN